jgi:hypothetical protein
VLLLGIALVSICTYMFGTKAETTIKHWIASYLTRIATGALLVTVLFGCEDSNYQSIFAAENIRKSPMYPFCEWIGEVRAGKPEGFGTGICVIGREPMEKRSLAPPLRKFLAETANSPVDQICLSSTTKECECQGAVGIAARATIDDYTTFQGTYADGQRNGAGIFFYSDGRVYIGGWLHDKRHGSGTLYGQECEIEYTGEWCRDKPQRCHSTSALIGGNE